MIKTPESLHWLKDVDTSSLVDKYGLLYNSSSRLWESAVVGDMTKAVYDPQNEGAIRLTPISSSSGAKGTIYYDSDDDHVWVATE